MPLLFYGRIESKKRQLYSPDLRPLESSVFDNYKIKHLAPYHPLPALANLWWLEDRKHTAISWNESRIDITLHMGIVANEDREHLKEQTIFIPGLIGWMEALEVARSEFPDHLVPGAICFRFNNQDGAYRYHD